MKHLLLLHGALGSSAQLQPMAELLKPHFHVHLPDFAGHGGRSLPESFSIEFFANEVLQYCDTHNLNEVAVFGYSMGGYVGLYLALHHPQLFPQVVTLGTKLYWSEAIAVKETAMMNPAVIQQKVPAFAQQLQERHAPQDWQAIMRMTADMLTRMGDNNPIALADFARITSRVLLMLGDRDKMVSLEETIATYKAIPCAQMALLPGTPHPIEQVNIHLLSLLVNQFLAE